MLPSFNLTVSHLAGSSLTQRIKLGAPFPLLLPQLPALHERGSSLIAHPPLYILPTMSANMVYGIPSPDCEGLEGRACSPAASHAKGLHSKIVDHLQQWNHGCHWL